MLKSITLQGIFFNTINCVLNFVLSDLMASVSNDTSGDSRSNSITIVPPIPATVPINHREKLKKFNGIDFKRWQQKMLFYLNILNLTRFLHEATPTLEEDESDVQMVAAVDA